MTLHDSHRSQTAARQEDHTTAPFPGPVTLLERPTQACDQCDEPTTNTTVDNPHDHDTLCDYCLEQREWENHHQEHQCDNPPNPDCLCTRNHWAENAWEHAEDAWKAWKHP
ncbi:hypothetical protein [Nesterenkonia flava]|uniref:Uncharacterized protein n=1 Tax=Nesterenkonia flava TaxID=469799 RepID=A0ABU1FX74_9MICC|nr:hypothetical protein [Nesterenkonia flava]MDR5712937.1 hypothetical protein [Nesterenkonia flava]